MCYQDRTSNLLPTPSATSHLHNGHTASESDGNPQDWIDSGEFWDHHYANFPSGGDSREKLTTLWYHDHRLDFTAANVYAGLAGFYLLFDESALRRNPLDGAG
jgi:FtsP/CotA-like multicopper oxidase with cupredoxin domain